MLLGDSNKGETKVKRKKKENEWNWNGGLVIGEGRNTQHPNASLSRSPRSSPRHPSY